MSDCAVTEIVRELIKLDRAKQRAAFGTILAFLRRETGVDVDSLHDFVAGRCAKQLPSDRRAVLLSTVARAVRSDDVASLQPSEKSPA